MSAWQHFLLHIVIHLPRDGHASIYMEQNQSLNKLIWSATLTLCPGAVAAQGRSRVAYLNWVPPYYRSKPSPTRPGQREIVSEMDGETADFVWRLSRRLYEAATGPNGQDPAALGVSGCGHLRITTVGGKLDMCQLTEADVNLLRSVLDFRVNTELKRVKQQEQSGMPG